MATIFVIGPSMLRATSGLAEQLRETIIGPSVLRATSGLAEQLRETTIFGIFPLVVVVGAAAVTLLAFTPEGIVVGF